jgi:chemotaxis methyl-accepting protein methylase
MIAWHNLSRLGRAIYWPVIRRAHRPETTRARVLLLNPDARHVVSADPRVDFRVHDVFTPWDGPRPDIIKVANLLRRLYFDDEQIRRGLRALLSSLDEGGHLLLVDNPRIAGIDERACLYRRQDGGFALVAQTPHPAEIDDLVRLVTAN